MTTARGDNARAAREAIDARDFRYLLRQLARGLTTEPWWLRGLDWRLVGMGAGVALAFSTVVVGGSYAGDWNGIGTKGLFVLTLNAIAGLAILLIATVLSNIERARLPLPLILAIAVIVGPLLANLFMVAQHLGDLPDFLTRWPGREIFVAKQVLKIALPWGLAAGAWYFSRRAAQHASELRAAELDRRRLETGMIEARLQALQAQVEPHFLFNTLAHVKRLYRTDPARARQMLDSFRAYLHSALPQMRGTGATLGWEIDLARAYLDVQQIRMGRRLKVSVTAPKSLRAHPFPSMMLISLVENAIKHGLNPLPRGGLISIVATQTDGFLSVSVADTGHGIDDQLGSGVGLSNIRDRLAALFGSDGRLLLAPRVPHGVAATIEIPLTDLGSDAVGGSMPADLSHAKAA
jgi:signal transduction histidine kinase